MLSVLSFFFFTGLVGLLTWYITRRDEKNTSVGYFLAGRSLTFPLIAASMLLTNLSTEQMVGLNGSAFTDGLAVMVWEVLAVVALIAMALFFLPKFLRLGVATVPQYLHQRYDRQTELITNLIFLIAYALILIPIILYTGATGLIGILNLDQVMGAESFQAALWIIVVAVGVVGSIYALLGGTRVMAVADFMNGILLLTGGLMIIGFGLNAVSGDSGGIIDGWNVLRAEVPEKFNSIGGPETSVPFSTVFTGILLLNLFYWCTNQQIIQRTFGASSLAEGQKGVLLTGFLKLIGPLYLVLPGIVAFYLFQGQDIKADHAYGSLVNLVLPPYLSGFFAAAMFGAIMSSFNAALNSSTTLFSLGLYQKKIRPDASDREVVHAGRVFGAIVAVVGILVAPLLAQTESIFSYLQKMNGMYFIPIFAVVLFGMLNKRVPALAAKVGLIFGFVAIAIGYFVPPFTGMVASLKEYHFLGIIFLCILAIMGIITLVKPQAQPFDGESTPEAVDMTPWKLAPFAGLFLFVIIIAIYWYFADFGAAYGN
ncbi:MAG: SSS sodium solute transporter superfamily protein [Puniceicoccaceae bacterium 5H]|nr:MAG: SSS sodium solute transporter superfamily protein [Puniceicoccaceae bacterium 5H]